MSQMTEKTSVAATVDAQPAPKEPRPLGTADPKARKLMELKDLYKSFGPLKVLRGVSLDFLPNQTTVVIGASGTGKSVLLKLIVGLLRPDLGEVYYQYRGNRLCISKYTERKLSLIRKDFGFLFQMGALFDSMTVGENVGFALMEHTKKNQKEIRQLVYHNLSMVGLEEKIDKMPSELSGGQRKRVSLARAIALRPQIVLYDEPTTGLDPITSDLINELIIKLKQDLGVTSIVVTHDMASAFKVADRIVMLFEGKVIADGTPQDIKDSVDDRVMRFIEGRADADDLAALRKTRETSLTRSWFFDGMP